MGGFKDIFKMFGSKTQEPAGQQFDVGPAIITVNVDLPAQSGGSATATASGGMGGTGGNATVNVNTASGGAAIDPHAKLAACIDFIDRLRLLLDSRPTYKFGSDGMLVVDFTLGSENNAVMRIEPGKGVPVASPASGAHFAQVHGPYFAYDYRKEMPAVARCNAIGEVLDHIAHHAATFEPNKAAQIQTLKDAVMADLTGNNQQSRGPVMDGAESQRISTPATVGPLDILGIRARGR